jgi:hypothetical protein
MSIVIDDNNNNNNNNLLEEAITFMETKLFGICTDHNIMVTAHIDLQGCSGKFIVHRGHTKLCEILLLQNYENKLRKLLVFSHELGHYFAWALNKNLSDNAEEIYAHKFFLQLLNDSPEWIIMTFKDIVYDYGLLPKTYHDTQLYMKLFNVTVDNIERSYIENKKIGVE